MLLLIVIHITSNYRYTFEIEGAFGSKKDQSSIKKEIFRVRLWKWSVIILILLLCRPNALLLRGLIINI